MEIESSYEENKSKLIRLLSEGKLESVDMDSIDFIRSPTCYFCQKKIQGRLKYVVSGEGKSEEIHLIHASCYSDKVEERAFAV